MSAVGGRQIDIKEKSLFHRTQKPRFSNTIGGKLSSDFVCDVHPNISSKQMADRDVVSRLNQMRLRLSAGDSDAGRTGRSGSIQILKSVESRFHFVRLR
jgi:hypothetical protein